MIQLLIIIIFRDWYLEMPSGEEEKQAVLQRQPYPSSLTMHVISPRSTEEDIQSVPVGQEEAGLVLGMTRTQIFFKITLLQMIKRIVPPMSNEIITLVKDTSLARIIALQEVIWAGPGIYENGSQGISGAIWPLFFTAVYYLIFNGVLTVLLGRLEKKLDYFR